MLLSVPCLRLWLIPGSLCSCATGRGQESLLSGGRDVHEIYRFYASCSFLASLLTSPVGWYDCAHVHTRYTVCTRRAGLRHPVRYGVDRGGRKLVIETSIFNG